MTGPIQKAASVAREWMLPYPAIAVRQDRGGGLSMSALAAGCLIFTLVGSPAEERQAALLIDGIQTAGGDLARCELRVVVRDPEATPGEALRAGGATVVPLERNTVLDGYPLAERAVAAAQVERSAGPG